MPIYMFKVMVEEYISIFACKCRGCFWQDTRTWKEWSPSQKRIGWLDAGQGDSALWTLIFLFDV